MSKVKGEGRHSVRGALAQLASGRVERPRDQENFKEQHRLKVSAALIEAGCKPSSYKHIR